jgi:spore germination protein KB
MLEQGRVSCRQTIYMLINLVGATSIIFLPGITAAAAGRDAWLAPLLTTLPGIYLSLVIYSLGRRFPGRTLIEYLQLVLGSWAGRAVGLLYIFFFLHTNGVIVREFGELLVTLVLPRTPMTVMHVLILALCAWTVRGGLEIQARVMELTIPPVLIVFLIAVALTAGNMEPKNLLPFWEGGFKPVLRASLDPLGWRGEIILLAMFFPYLANPGRGGRCAVIATIVIGLILTVDSLANTAVFGTSVARMTFPTFSLVRMVSVAQFVERIESVLVAVWFIGLFGKICLFYYGSVLGAAQLAGLRDYRPLVLPVGVLLAAFSINSVEDSAGLLQYIVKGFPPIAYTFEYVIPTVLLVVAAARGMKARKAAGGSGGKTH